MLCGSRVRKINSRSPVQFVSHLMLGNTSNITVSFIIYNTLGNLEIVLLPKHRGGRRGNMPAPLKASTKVPFSHPAKTIRIALLSLIFHSPRLLCKHGMDDFAPYQPQTESAFVEALSISRLSVHTLSDIPN